MVATGFIASLADPAPGHLVIIEGTHPHYPQMRTSFIHANNNEFMLMEMDPESARAASGHHKVDGVHHYYLKKFVSFSVLAETLKFRSQREEVKLVFASEVGCAALVDILLDAGVVRRNY